MPALMGSVLTEQRRALHAKLLLQTNVELYTAAMCARHFHLAFPTECVFVCVGVNVCVGVCMSERASANVQRCNTKALGGGSGQNSCKGVGRARVGPTKSLSFDESQCDGRGAVAASALCGPGGSG